MVPKSDEENFYALHLRELEIWMSLAYMGISKGRLQAAGAL
jgi:hypothetical protein